MITSADIIRKRDLFLSVYIPTETASFMTGRASMAAANTFVGLEYKSVYIHIKMRKMQKAQIIIVWNKVHAFLSESSCRWILIF